MWAITSVNADADADVWCGKILKMNKQLFIQLRYIALLTI